MRPAMAGWPGGGQFKVAELVGCACLSEHSPLMPSARNAIRGYGRAGFCGLSAMFSAPCRGNRPLEFPDLRAISLALRPGTLLGG